MTIKSSGTSSCNLQLFGQLYAALTGGRLSILHFLMRRRTCGDGEREGGKTMLIYLSFVLKREIVSKERS
jgi:hypothetical protein